MRAFLGESEFCIALFRQGSAGHNGGTLFAATLTLWWVHARPSLRLLRTWDLSSLTRSTILLTNKRRDFDTTDATLPWCAASCPPARSYWGLQRPPLKAIKILWREDTDSW